MKKIIVAGIGPGSREDITPAVLEAVKEADVVVGYKYYFQFLQPSKLSTIIPTFFFQYLFIWPRWVLVVAYKL